MMKKIVCLLMCGAMLIAFLSACGGSGNGGQQAQATTTAAAATSAAAEGETVAAAEAVAEATSEAATEETAATMDLTTSQAPAAAATSAAVTEPSGEKITIIMQRPLWGSADPDFPPNVRIREAIRDILGFDVQVVGQVNPDDANEKPNLMLAAGEQLDIFQTDFDPANYWEKYRKMDAIIPLNDLLDQYGQDMKASMDPISLQLLSDKDGNIWGLPDEQNSVTACLYVRKDLMDKYGLETPVTIEDYEHMMQTFIDQNNDEGFVGFFSAAWNLDIAFAGAFMPFPGGNGVKYINDKGELVPSFMHPTYKDFLAKMAEWYAKGYVHKETATLQYQQAVDIAGSGRAALQLDWVSGGFGVQAEGLGLTANVPEAELMVIAPPQGAYNSGVVSSSTVSCNIMITSSCKHPDLAMQFLNWSQATDEGWLMCKYGQEGIDWYWVDKANNILQYTDLEPDVERMGYAIYCSTRLNKFSNKYFVGDNLGKLATEFMHDKSRYPSMMPPDEGVMYDLSRFKAENLINPLNSYIEQEKLKIIMGQNPVDEWDNVVAKWLADGGQTLIDDYTEQYNELK